MDSTKKKGRPLGSKDGPRPPDAPRPIRPPKLSVEQSNCEGMSYPNMIHGLIGTFAASDHDADDEFGFDDDFPEGFDWEAVSRVEREALANGEGMYT
jgi:hypothetical protein